MNANELTAQALIDLLALNRHLRYHTDASEEEIEEALDELTKTRAAVINALPSL